MEGRKVQKRKSKKYLLNYKTYNVIKVNFDLYLVILLILCATFINISYCQKELFPSYLYNKILVSFFSLGLYDVFVKDLCGGPHHFSVHPWKTTKSAVGEYFIFAAFSQNFLGCISIIMKVQAFQIMG
ncbi:hypothetical protein Avbf_03294 [Armadillidium vulgare]|nr:hypothetical protein Avbf_03294 [Armadillidium vulgare]